jgi:CNT family concentrative nucleoside transporter
MNVLHGVFGLACLLGLALVLSENRRAIPWRVVVAGLALQAALALLLLKFPPASAFMATLASAVGALDKATEAGTSFVFGYLGGAPLPFEPSGKGSPMVFAFHVFPLILVICALSALLFHWGLMQKVVRGMAFALRHTVGVGGALGTGAAVNFFVGMVESPILIRPYLAQMQRGEIFALMSAGMAGIAGSVMVIYGHILGGAIPEAFGHVLTAALISAPAAIAVAAILIPFEPSDERDAAIVIADPPRNALEALARGTSDGVVILAHVLAHLIVLLALVALLNAVLGALPDLWGAPLSLQRIFAWLFRPLAFAIGVDAPDVDTAARLLGTKIALNEFIAYIDLAALPESALSPRSRLILLYALCGFANFGSVGILVGGLCAMAPERKHDIVALGSRARRRRAGVADGRRGHRRADLRRNALRRRANARCSIDADRRQRLMQRREDFLHAKRLDKGVLLQIDAQTGADPAHDDVNLLFPEFAEQVAERPRGGIVYIGQRGRVDYEMAHRRRRLGDQVARLVGETVGVGVEQIGAVWRPGCASLGSQRPSAFGASMAICGR